MCQKFKYFNSIGWICTLIRLIRKKYNHVLYSEYLMSAGSKHKACRICYSFKNHDIILDNWNLFLKYSIMVEIQHNGRYIKTEYIWIYYQGAESPSSTCVSGKNWYFWQGKLCVCTSFTIYLKKNNYQLKYF